MKIKVYNFDKYFEENPVQNEKGFNLEVGEYHQALVFDMGDKFMVSDNEACREIYSKENPFEITMRRAKVKTEKGWSISIFPDSLCRFPFEEIISDVPTEEIEFNDFFDRIHSKDRIWRNFYGMMQDLEDAGLTNEAAAFRAMAKE